MTSREQLQFDFRKMGASDQEDGLTAWRKQRREALASVGRQVGLPLGRRVEVRLTDGLVLRGRLGLKHERLFPEPARSPNLELQVEGVSFRQSEIEACVTLD